jgi:hypothetical protein
MSLDFFIVFLSLYTYSGRNYFECLKFGVHIV